MNGNNNIRHRRHPDDFTTTDATKEIKDLSNSDVNPFTHSITLSPWDKVKCAFLTVLLLPVRVVCIAVCIVTAYVLASIGLVGISEEELWEKPMTGWRRSLRSVISWWVYMLFVVGGFYRVTVKGVRAEAREAPLLTLAPHSSYFDCLPVVALSSPSLIIKAESQDMPFFAKLIRYTQPVFVWREDPNSRQNTIKEIVRRATSKIHQWQQILIFPEGTCTNRQALITFKPGAFYPGVPVQPVCIRYPNRLDTISWTWQGPSALKLLWLTLTQFYTNCEIEFLPVYRPSEEEKQNPKLYAQNVRNVMAKALGIPVTDYTYEDCRLMNKARHLGLPPSVGLVEVQKLRDQFGVKLEVVEKDLIEEYARIADPSTGLISFEGFANHFKLDPHELKVKELFRLYDTDKTGFLNFKNFIQGRWTVSVPASERLRTNDLPVNDGIHQNIVNCSSLKDLSENDARELIRQQPEWAWLLEQSL